MPTLSISDITDYLEKIAPLQYQESYDNSGLLTGHPEMEIKKALICLDCTEEVIDEAIREDCSLIIAHHPIIFNGLKSLTGKNYIERTIIKAIRHDVAIYAIHTNLDNMHQGVNAEISKRLNLIKSRILVPKKGLLKKLYTFCPVEKAGEVRAALFKAGAGSIGEYDQCSFNSEGTGTFRGSESTDPYVGEKNEQHHEQEMKIEVIFPVQLEQKVLNALFHAHPYEEVAYDIILLENAHEQIGSGMIGELEQEIDASLFLGQVKEKMGAACIRHTRLTEKKIKKVAVCGGSGSFLLSAAIAQKADVFITSDFKYHQFFDAEDKLLIADIGHYESEQFTKNLIYNLLIEKFPTFAVRLSDINTNPINYL